MASNIMKIEDYLSKTTEEYLSFPAIDKRVRIFYNPKFNCFVCQEKTINHNSKLSDSKIYTLETQSKLPNLQTFTAAEREDFLLDTLKDFSINTNYTIGNMMFTLRGDYINLDNIYTNKFFRESGFAKELVHDLYSTTLNEDLSMIKFTIFPLDSLSIDNKITNDIAQFFFDKKAGIPRSKLITLNSLIQIYNNLGFEIEKADLMDSIRFPASKIQLTQPILPNKFTTFEKSKEPVILYK